MGAANTTPVGGRRRNHPPRPVVLALMTALTAAGTMACGAAAPETATAGSAITLVHDEPSPPIDVSARANIFGAGHDVPPDPGGGGPGVLPPVVHLPTGGARVLRFPSVTGEVNPIMDDNGAPEADYVGPGGDDGRFGTTDVKSHGGISGVVHRRNGMFLVGVVLSDAPPPEIAPERLDLTDQQPTDASVPKIGQTFLIGDGRGRAVRVPEGGTRLYLGFADAYTYRGLPGWYDNNDGRLAVTIQIGAT